MYKNDKTALAGWRATPCLSPELGRCQSWPLACGDYPECALRATDRGVGYDPRNHVGGAIPKAAPIETPTTADLLRVAVALAAFYRTVDGT
jgi:hypothetical protein